MPVGRASSESVFNFRVDMEFGGYVHLAQFLIDGGRGDRRAEIGVAVNEAHGRSRFVERELFGERGRVPCFKDPRGVDGNGEIDVAWELVDIVDRFVRVRLA